MSNVREFIDAFKRNAKAVRERCSDLPRELASRRAAHVIATAPGGAIRNPRQVASGHVPGTVYAGKVLREGGVSMFNMGHVS